MEAMPVPWHEECLRNMKIGYKEKLRVVKAVQDDADRLKKNIEELEAQIARAKSEGKEKFDGEKYNKSKTKG